MKAGTRLYNMGGDIVSNFYPSGSAQSTILSGGKDKKKRNKQSKTAKRNTPNQGFKDKCYKRN
jgi:hypothetical protein